MCMKRTFIVFLILAAACSAAMASAAEPLEQALFDRVLAGDRLALRPAALALPDVNTSTEAEIERYIRQVLLYGNEEETIGPELEQPRIVSISPDGNRFLLSVPFGPLMVWDEAGGTLRLIAPSKGMDADYVNKAYLPRLRRAEDVGVTWSHDGKRIAISCRRDVVTGDRMFGTVLIDAKIGEARPVVPQPDRIVLGYIEYPFPGVPFRAAFDPADGSLYYDSYGSRATKTADRMNTIKKYIPGIGMTILVDTYSSDETTFDPFIWKTDDALL